MSWLVNTEKLAGTLHFKAKPKHVGCLVLKANPPSTSYSASLQNSWLGTAINAIFVLLTLWLQKFP